MAIDQLVGMNASDQPLTQAQLQEALSQLQTSFTAQVDEKLTSLQNILSEQMRDIETAILKGFHGYAQGVSAQLQN